MLSELFPLAQQARLRTAVHATFGPLNSTPHSAVELPAQSLSDLLFTMAHSALLAAGDADSPHAAAAVPISAPPI